MVAFLYQLRPNLWHLRHAAVLGHALDDERTHGLCTRSGAGRIQPSFRSTLPPATGAAFPGRCILREVNLPGGEWARSRCFCFLLLASSSAFFADQNQSVHPWFIILINIQSDGRDLLSPFKLR